VQLDLQPLYYLECLGLVIRDCCILRLLSTAVAAYLCCFILLPLLQALRDTVAEHYCCCVPLLFPLLLLSPQALQKAD
jgi:hypothetical protein